MSANEMKVTMIVAEIQEIEIDGVSVQPLETPVKLQGAT